MVSNSQKETKMHILPKHILVKSKFRKTKKKSLKLTLFLYRNRLINAAVRCFKNSQKLLF